MKTLKILAVVFLYCSAAFCQNSRTDGIVFSRNGAPAPGAQVAICSQVAITAASESLSTVTITSTLNPPQGSTVTIVGVSPTAYNGAYTVLTTSGSNFTYTNPTQGLGPGTVFGSAVVTSTTPCSPLAPLCASYTDTGCTAPNPVTADGLGNYNFYVKPGHYTAQFYGSGLTARLQPDQILACDPANCTLSNATISGALSAGAATFTSLNGDLLTTNPKDQFGNPTVTTLGIGPLGAVKFGASTNNNTNLVVGNDIPASNGGTYTLGAAAVIPVTSCTGTLTLNAICEGSQTIGISYGAFVNNGFFQPSITGVEADCQSISTGGLWDNCYGVHAAATVFSGSTNFTYFAALHTANGINSGSGTVTGAFGLISENQTAGTVHYGIWNKGNQLINNGFSLQWMGALTTTTSATMTGCPGACLVTVTDTSHGYSTNDLVYYLGSSPQYNGFYQITRVDANTFTFPAKAPYPSNASNDGSATVSKMPGGTAPFHLAVNSLSELTISNPFINTSTNGAISFQVLGNNTLCFKSPFWIVDCAAAGFALEIPATSGLQFLGGSGADITGTTGSTGNVVMASGTKTIAGVTNFTGLIAGSNTQRLTADASPIATTTPGTTVFTWGALPVSTNFSFHCEILYNQQTATGGVGLAVQGATNAPTRLDAWGNIYTSNAGVAVEGSTLNLTSTTATSVVTGTPSAITTVFQATLNGTIQVGASASTLNILMYTGSGADTVTPKAGSYCTLMP